MAQVEVNVDRADQVAGVVQGDLVGGHSTRVHIQIHGDLQQHIHVGTAHTGPLHIHISLTQERGA